MNPDSAKRAEIDAGESSVPDIADYYKGGGDEEGTAT
jgi:hypothetical protein